MEQDYAAMARRHTQRHRPATYAELMRDPAEGEQLLDRIGHQVATQVALTERQLLESEAVPPGPSGERRRAQARAIAEELVLSELLWTPGETVGSETGPSGAYEGWEPGHHPTFEDLPGLLAR